MTLARLERPMTTTAARVLVAALVLLPLVAPMASAAPTSFTIDVVAARSLGCSPDSFSSPDLRVRIYVNGNEIFTTEKAQDQDSPLYGNAIQASAELPARIGVEIEEAEPGGFFFLGTSWVTCQAGPGGATRGEFLYNGERALQAVVRGEGEKAAEALLVVGTAPPTAPVVTAGPSTPTSVTLRWGADETGRATGHRVALGLAGARVAATVTGNEAVVPVPCDNYAYTFRVIREAAPWYVTSADVSATSANAAPQPTNVLSATRDGNASFESPTTHDVQRYEIHASSSAGFAPSSATLRHTISAPPSAFAEQSATGIPFAASDTHVRVRTVDTGGLTADSAPFAIGASARESTIAFGSSCFPTTTAAGSASWPGTTTSTSPPPTPPSSTGSSGTSPAQPTGAIAAPTPTFPVDTSDLPCCYHLEVTAEGEGDPWPRLLSGGATSVVVRNTGTQRATFTLQVADKAGRVDFEAVDGSFTLLANESLRRVIDVRAEAGAPAGTVTAEIVAVPSADTGTTGSRSPATILVTIPEPTLAATADEDGASVSLSTGLAIAGAGTAAAAGGAALLLRRDAARFAVAAALYTRLKRSDVLQHAGREDLLQRITREPGICYTDLKRATEMNTGAIVHHLRAMERSSLITSRKEGAFRRFYAMGAAPATSSTGMVRAMPALTPMQARVVALLEAAPLTQAEMAERLGLSQQGMSHHVKALERAGHIAPEFDGKAWRYRVVHRFEVVN